MKKIIAVILTVVLVLASGCAKKDSGLKVDAVTTADQITRSLKFTDQMSPVDDSTALQLFELDKNLLQKWKVYESTGATAEEVAVFDANNADAAQKVKVSVEQRIANQKASFADYQPIEMKKLKEPILIAVGNSVILCVTNDNNAAQKEIGSLIK